MKNATIVTVLAAIVTTLALECSTSCGNDKHAIVNPTQPQQTKIAFMSGRATGDVDALPYIMNRNDGSGVTPVPYSGMPAIPRGITVSPDDSKVLAEIDGNQPTQVYTAKPDGTAWTALTSSGSNRAPRWSPDGKQIVFHSNRDGSPGPWKIYLMNTDGSSQARLSPLDNTIYDTSPSFSPDGKQIVFFCWNGTPQSGIWTMSTDGSNRNSVIAYVAEMGQTFAFSPDGMKILWVDNSEIASVNLDGSGKTILTSSGGKISELMTVGSEVWFTTSQDGNLEVYKMNADGSGQKNMTNDPHADLIGIYVP